MSPVVVLLYCRLGTLRRTRTADMVTSDSDCVHGVVDFSSSPTAVSFSTPEKPDMYVCDCVPARESTCTSVKFSVPSALATGVSLR
jgi:hypothetical protein